MARLIDADLAIAKVKDDGILGAGYSDNERIDDVCDMIDCCPTVEAVEVVRCKNCMNYEERCPGFGYCYHWDYESGMSPNQVDADDFCSYGERRTDVKEL